MFRGLGSRQLSLCDPCDGGMREQNERGHGRFIYVLSSARLFPLGARALDVSFSFQY